MTEIPWQAIKRNGSDTLPSISNDQTQVTKFKKDRYIVNLPWNILLFFVRILHRRTLGCTPHLLSVLELLISRKPKNRNLPSLLTFLKSSLIRQMKLLCMCTFFTNDFKIWNYNCLQCLENYKIPLVSWKKHCTGSNWWKGVKGAKWTMPSLLTSAT